MEHIAKQFGTALDNDDFELAKRLLSPHCSYDIGDEVLHGPEAIAGSYEANMIEGRKKMDKLEWGQCTIETIEPGSYFVHFTDYLTHKGETYTFQCKQKLTVEADKIVRIEHIHDADAWEHLQAWYRSVGIPTKS